MTFNNKSSVYLPIHLSGNPKAFFRFQHLKSILYLVAMVFDHSAKPVYLQIKTPELRGRFSTRRKSKEVCSANMIELSHEVPDHARSQIYFLVIAQPRWHCFSKKHLLWPIYGQLSIAVTLASTATKIKIFHRRDAG